MFLHNAGSFFFGASFFLMKKCSNFFNSYLMQHHSWKLIQHGSHLLLSCVIWQFFSHNLTFANVSNHYVFIIRKVFFLSLNTEMKTDGKVKFENSLETVKGKNLFQETFPNFGSQFETHVSFRDYNRFNNWTIFPFAASCLA